MNHLPKDLLTLVLYALPYPDLLILGKDYPICQTERFWQELLHKDFEKDGKNPQELYIKHYLTSQYILYSKLVQKRKSLKYNFDYSTPKSENLKDQITEINKQIDDFKVQLGQVLRLILPPLDYKFKVLYDSIYNSRKLLKPGNLVTVGDIFNYIFFWNPEVSELRPDYIGQNITIYENPSRFYPSNLLEFLSKYLCIEDSRVLNFLISILYPDLPP